MPNHKDIFLLISVFVTGAVVLIVEIVATRVLSPYFGNTIFTTSSVIGVVLAALSCGYYAGGRLADKYPDEKFFYGIIFVSGLAVIFVQVCNNGLLPLLGLLPITTGPLIASLCIFFLPALLLGTLSPFAVKLHKKSPDAVGSQSGEVFFWSTLGSIVGSLAAGFYLIPHFGIHAIIIGCGIFLSAWGLLGLILTKTISRQMTVLPLLLIMTFLVLSWYNPVAKNPGVLYEADGVYEKIKIQNGEWNGQPVRFLFQDRSYSAAMNLATPDKSQGHFDGPVTIPAERGLVGGGLAYDYTKYYSLYKLIKPDPKTAFIIGGGAYSIPKAILQDEPQSQVLVAEIEPSLFNLAKQYFNLPENPRLQNYTEDGRHFLSKTSAKYDVMVSDVYYSLFSIPAHFTTKEFFTLARGHLTDNGVFIGNFAGYLHGDGSRLLVSEITTFREVFPDSYFFAVNSPGSDLAQNIIFLGINGEKTIDFESSLVKNNANPILKNLAQKNINLAGLDFSKAQRLTDDFAPVEYLVAGLIKQWQK